MQPGASKQAYKFTVDGKEYQSTQQVITGEEFRKIAQIGPHRRIFAGDHHNHQPDSEIHNSSSINLSKAGKTKFYTLDAPIMDIY